MLFRSGITYSAQCDFAVHIKKPPKKRVAYHKSGRLRRKSKEIVPSGNKFDNTYVVYWWKVLESRALTAGVQYLYRRWWLIMMREPVVVNGEIGRASCRERVEGSGGEGEIE